MNSVRKLNKVTHYVHITLFDTGHIERGCSKSKRVALATLRCDYCRSLDELVLVKRRLRNLAAKSAFR